MRIFTLGKKGVPLLFFAFNLLIGSLPSYGQETCPSEGDIVANPFCYLQTVSSLTNGNYPVYQTDDNENDTQPIPGDELLTDGVTYYVGGPSGDCDRIAVTATVEVVERPTNTIFPNSPSFEITPCSSTNFTADDLADYFVAQPGYEIEVYTTEFGTTEAQGELVPDQSYFVGQVSTTNPDACPSLRAAVGYNPIDPNPPIATSPQVFCEGATVADLEAEGTYDNTQAIRWYRSMDANSPLPDNTQLINGQFYYASQIVNDRNDPFPPCESDERTAVFVEVQSIEAGEQIGDGIYCQSEIDNRLATTAPQQLVRELFTEQLESGVPTDGTFTNLSINEVISQYQSGVRSFSTTYTVTSEQGCEDSVELSFSIEEDFNAGEDNTTTTLCRSELPDTLTEEGAEGFFRSLLSENADANGTFSAQTIAEITAAFNSGDGTGTYSTTYSGGTGECADSAEIEVTVLEGGNAGDDADLVFCQSEIEALIAEFSADPTQNPEAFLAEWIGDRDTNGTFSGDPLTSIISQYQAGTWPIEVSTVYTIGAGTECEDSAQISLTVIEGDVVEDNSETICISDVPVLFQEIPEDVRAYFVDLAGGAEGGTFEPSIESLITQYGQNNLGDFRTVYTIGEGTSCEDSAELILTITDELPADAGDDRTLSFCTTEGPQDLAEFLTAGAMEDGTFSGDLDQTFDPATVGPGTYNVTYTVDDSSACVASGDQDTASFSITISEGENVVEDNSQTICITEVPVLFQEVPEDVRAYYVTLAGGVEGGTFEPSIEALIEQYGENNFGDFRTVYTVGEGTACEDSAELVVTIIDEQPAEAGDIAPQVVCSTDGMIDLSDYLAGSGATMGGTFSGTGVTNGMFDPSTGIDTYTITYSVDDSADCVTPGTEDSETFTIQVLEGIEIEEEVISETLCVTDVPTDFDVADFETFYMNLLGDIPTTGTFTPSLTELFADFQDNPVGTFSTTYMVGSEECGDSVEVSVTIDPLEDAEAGDIAPQVVCSTDGMIDLSDYLAGSGATMGGTFSGTGVTNGMFDPSTGIDTYTITYSVDDSADCVTPGTEDSETFTIQVLEGIEIEEEVISETLCVTDVPTDFDVADFETFYMNLLGDIPTTGTFTPSLTELFADFQDNPVGTFSTTYMVGSEECGDSVEVSVTIDPLEDAEAGDIAPQVVCSTDGMIDLSDYLAGSGATMGGTFSGTGVTNGMFDPSTGIDTYTITYSVDDTANCVTPGTEDSETFTIQVLEGVDAGTDQSEDVCNSEVRTMFPNTTAVRNFYLNFLDEGVPTTGTFNPSIESLVARYNSGDQIGDFSTTYTISNGQCEDSVELNITILPNLSAGRSATVNLEEDATETVDLFEELEGTPATGGTWTFDGEEVDGTFDPATDEEGAYVYTVTSENGCTASATVTVIVGTVEPGCTEENTPAAPTVAAFDDCAANDPTINDLVITGEVDAVFTVYSDEALETEVDQTEVLTEGTYYVTQTNAAGCESLATTVTVTLSVSDAPTLVANGECTPINGTIADLEESVSANGEITWYATATSTDPLSRTMTLVDGTTYYATSTNSEGCESSERLAVTADFCPIVIPEIFTPNGDGINDKFVILGISSEYPNHMLEIYNRWGEPVFIGKAGEDAGWDGTSTEGSFGSGVVPAGVYFYILYYNDGQTAPTQGRLYLSR